MPSANQAAAKLKRFEAFHPGALSYDTGYRAGSAFRASGEDDVRDLLRQLRLIAEGVFSGE